MAFRYSASVREAACRRMLAGKRVEGVAGDLEMSAAALYRWKRQALIDVGRKPGVSAIGSRHASWPVCQVCAITICAALTRRHSLRWE
jgi:hypothetical protein